MLASFVAITIPLLIILLITVLHLPRWIQRLVLWTPAWLQSATIHFGYGGWIGGVTGGSAAAIAAIVRAIWSPVSTSRLSEKSVLLAVVPLSACSSCCFAWINHTGASWARRW